MNSRMSLFALAWLVMSGPVVALALSQVKPQIGYIPMKDGTKIAYILYLPQQDGRFPVLMTYNPYAGGGTGLGGEEKAYLANGYGVLAVSARGSGCSEGVFRTFLEPPQSQDGATVVEWAGSQPWSDGNVGMYGNSYSGVSQLITAAERPKHLKALAASGIVADGYQDLSYPGGIFNFAFVGRWTYGAQVTAALEGVRSRQKMGDSDCAANRARQLPAGDSFVQHRSHPLRDEWWDHLDFESKAQRIEAATLLMQGWQDQETGSRGPGRVYQALKGPKKLILSNGPHNLVRQAELRAERIRWFNRWLKGEQNGIDKEPRVTIWFEAQGEAGLLKPAWTWTFSDWPIPEVKWTTLYMTPDGRLNKQKPGEQTSGIRSYIYPLGTEIVQNDSTFRIPPAPEGILIYRTDPMSEDTVIVGAPVATLYASSDQKDTDFMLVLHEVRSDGQIMYLQRGFLRASHRRIDPKKSTPEEPFLPHDRVEELVPGNIYEFQVATHPLGHVIRRGHSLEVAIMAPPTIPLPNWAFILTPAAAINTVHHSPQYPSSIRIPVLPGRRAEAPLPKCGSLPFQPCRPSSRELEGQRSQLDEVFKALHEKKMPDSLVKP